MKSLTHFQPIFHFYTLLKISENIRFSDVFRGYKSGTLVENKFKKVKCETFLGERVFNNKPPIKFFSGFAHLKNILINSPVSKMIVKSKNFAELKYTQSEHWSKSEGWNKFDETLWKSGANVGFFHTQSDMKVTRWSKAGQALGTNLVMRLPVT